MVIFNSYVSLPEGISVKCGFFTNKQHHLSHLVTTVTTVTTSWVFDHLWARYDRSHFVTPVGDGCSSKLLIFHRPSQKNVGFPRVFVGVFVAIRRLEWSWMILTYHDISWFSTAVLWIFLYEPDLRWKKCKGKSWKPSATSESSHFSTLSAPGSKWWLNA